MPEVFDPDWDPELEELWFGCVLLFEAEVVEDVMEVVEDRTLEIVDDGIREVVEGRMLE